MLSYEVDDFMSYCQIKNLAVKTISSYEQTLRLFVTYLKNEEGVEQAKAVTSAHIARYIAYVQDRGKYTVSDERWRYLHLVTPIGAFVGYCYRTSVS